jgi:ankyrin repeat protein
VVVTGRRQTASSAPRAFPGAEAPDAAEKATAGSPADQAQRLAAAAAAGRIREVKALLAKGVPVDAPDANGETALMRSVRADQPVVAALLLAHGASLDRENRTGQSARDIAAAIDDPRIDKALGLAP